MTRQLFYNGVIITADAQDTWYEHGYILVENGRIIKLGKWQEELLEQYQDVQEQINLKGNWVMPGWVNTHGHAAMSLLRGHADDLPLKDWLEKEMWPLEARFTADTVKWGTGLAIVEMLKSGTTTFLDMYDHMGTVAEMVKSSGMRAVLARGVIGLCSAEEQERKLQEAAQFAREWHQQADGRITTMMSPHAPYTCPPEYIKRIVHQAFELDLPVHIHMSETLHEVNQNVSDYGKRPVEHLKALGVFDRPTLVAHAVHLTEEEMDILKENDVKISHNPASNLKLGSGIAPISQLIQKGLKPAIGTDSAASNNNLDMFQEVRLAALLQKGIAQEPTHVPAQTALKMGTKWGAEALFIEDVGALEPGYQADFIVVNSQQAHLQPFVHHSASHLIYSAVGHDVKDVYIQGKQVVRDRECLYLDEEFIIHQATQAYRRLLQQ